jgi:hypothetical protein
MNDDNNNQALVTGIITASGAAQLLGQVWPVASLPTGTFCFAATIAIGWLQRRGPGHED